MKKSYWRFAYLLLPLFIFILLPNLVHAGPGDPGCGADDPCPIDSGLIFLIALGIAYGVKKIRHQRKVDSVS